MQISHALLLYRSYIYISTLLICLLRIARSILTLLPKLRSPKSISSASKSLRCFPPPMLMLSSPFYVNTAGR